MPLTMVTAVVIIVLSCCTLTSFPALALIEQAVHMAFWRCVKQQQLVSSLAWIPLLFQRIKSPQSLGRVAV